jgi:hypothetical protein
VKLDHLVLVFSQKMRPCDQIAMVHGRTKSISFVLSARIGRVLFRIQSQMGHFNGSIQLHDFNLRTELSLRMAVIGCGFDIDHNEIILEIHGEQSGSEMLLVILIFRTGARSGTTLFINMN